MPIKRGTINILEVSGNLTNKQLKIPVGQKLTSTHQNDIDYLWLNTKLFRVL